MDTPPTTLTGKREALYRRWMDLKTERSSWMPHWQEITHFLLPRSGRYFSQDRNQGGKRHNNIYDNTGTRALSTMGAGMMAGATSPARPWFALTTPDPDLNLYKPVQIWLADVRARLLRVFQRSNTYRALHQVYEEIGAFGTAANLVLPSFDTAIHNHPLTVGEYAITTDYQGKVVALFREFDLTVGQVVGEFGLENCSIRVKDLYRRGSLDKWVTVIHAIEQRKDRDVSKLDDMNMEWRSCYFEMSCNEDKLLSESGFRYFPALCPRWKVSGGDIYGNSPGMEALGDIKQLQHEQLRKAQGIDYQTKPPLQVPTALKNRDVDTLPGGVTYYDASNPQAGIRPSWEVNLRLDHLLEDIRDVRQRINSSFYADLFLMLATAGPNTRMTATEVAERHEEKLLMLGPVLERLHNELLEPLIDIAFTRLVETGNVPPPPEELQGIDLNVEFVSMLAQAQRAVQTNAVDRFVGNLGAIAQMKPEALDKFNVDEWTNVYSDLLGVDPRLVLADDQVAIIRQQRAQAQAAESQMAALQQGSIAAKNLASASTQDPSLLTDPTAMFTGYS
jgi:hypothetical protein